MRGNAGPAGLSARSTHKQTTLYLLAKVVRGTKLPMVKRSAGRATDAKLDASKAKSRHEVASRSRVRARSWPRGQPRAETRVVKITPTLPNKNPGRILCERGRKFPRGF
jgi:hypothetical protein